MPLKFGQPKWLDRASIMYNGNPPKVPFACLQDLANDGIRREPTCGDLPVASDFLIADVDPKAAGTQLL